MDPLKPLGVATALIVLGAIGLTFVGYQERKRAQQLMPAAASASAPEPASRGEPPRR